MKNIYDTNVKGDRIETAVEKVRIETVIEKVFIKFIYLLIYLFIYLLHIKILFKTNMRHAEWSEIIAVAQNMACSNPMLTTENLSLSLSLSLSLKPSSVAQ